MHRGLLAIFLFLVAGPATAQKGAPAIDLPIDCKLGENCDLVAFVDHDRSKAAAD